jgi:hypothetical protein
MSMIARPLDGTAFSEFSPVAHASLVAALFKKIVSIRVIFVFNIEKRGFFTFSSVGRPAAQKFLLNLA